MHSHSPHQYVSCFKQILVAITDPVAAPQCQSSSGWSTFNFRYSISPNNCTWRTLNKQASLSWCHCHPTFPNHEWKRNQTTHIYLRLKQQPSSLSFSAARSLSPLVTQTADVNHGRGFSAAIYTDSCHDTSGIFSAWHWLRDARPNGQRLFRITTPSSTVRSISLDACERLGSQQAGFLLPDR